MDNLPTLKPLKPRLEIEETTDRVKVTVTLKPRDKKRRTATNITESDLRVFLEAAGVAAGKLHEGPSGPTTNQNIESDIVTEWTFHKRDLRVKSTPPKSPTTRKSTKTTTKGK